MDIATAAKWMADEFLAVGISKKLGIIGFCFGGGRLIEVLSRDQGACFGVGVSFYGTRMDPSIASNVKVPVLFISGDNDPLCSVNVSKDIEKRIGHGSRVIVFQERGHGFAHRPNSPEEDRDAEQAFVLMRNWLHDVKLSLQNFIANCNICCSGNDARESDAKLRSSSTNENVAVLGSCMLPRAPLLLVTKMVTETR
ncbi:hypothetical protein GH714_016477 [Hevea brasiliensis]|uniref:Carboxymethylenebutenolidase homolog n=1 Tax=Hevea brasiliensis TaxID=3981 RepID=A0A6A6KQG6_HEVBR|nr:hypothetical protein GH714_016477 [Hevea brasiliensis]